uniref:Uncharacterized protein n=1 Tax=Opuntia streptacantha TaxID=393608 RepID=A0A7C9FNE4_OPUST
MKRKKTAQTSTILNLPNTRFDFPYYTQRNGPLNPSNLHLVSFNATFEFHSLIHDSTVELNFPPFSPVTRSLSGLIRHYLSPKNQVFSHMLFTRQTPNALGYLPMPFPLTNGTAE